MESPAQPFQARSSTYDDKTNDARNPLSILIFRAWTET